MNYQALYRKYRPETFDGVIGQDHIINTLKNQITTGKISHAYLFCGTHGTGKTSTAKILARAINCTASADGNPCLECSDCKYLEASNVDIIEMDAASNNGVDYARDIREKVQYPPTSCRFKVYIIDEVHMLSQGAFNALLKTLEEPPEHAVFILCTTEVHKIPATILSRCMRFDFKLVATKMLSEHIAKIYDRESKKYTQDAVDAIANAAEGSVRDCLSIADRCFSIGQGTLTYDDVLSVLGVSSTAAIFALAQSILNAKTGDILQSINDLVTGGKDVSRLNKDVTKCLRDMLVAKTAQNANSILCLPSDIFENLQKISQNVSVAKLLYSIDTLCKLEIDLRFALSPAMLFEATVLRISTCSGEVDVEGLDRRLSYVERHLDTVSQSANLVIVDKTSYKSIWLAAKVEIERLNKPLLLALWKEIDGKIENGKIVLSATKSQSLLIEMEFKVVLADVLNRLCAMPLEVNTVEVQQTNVDEQLKNLASNTRFEN